MTMMNCLTHGKPHARGGWCSEYHSAYTEATDAYIARRRIDHLDQFDSYLPEGLGDCRWEDARWPEPHEGIIGVQRDEDDLLNLSDEALERRKIICAIAYAFSSAMSVGNPAPVVQSLSKRFGWSWLEDDQSSGPQIGDLVIETTALYGYPGDRHRTGFGILLDKRTEWWTTKEEYDALLAEEASVYEDPSEFEPYPRITDTAWYVQYGSNPEAVCRWTNCSFIALPTSYEMVRAIT